MLEIRAVFTQGEALMPDITLDRDAPVYIAGHHGLAGSAIWRLMEAQGFSNLLGWRSADLDLRDRDATFDALSTAKPAVVVMAAAKVGGILANSQYPVDFLNDNLRIQTNLFEASHAADVDRLLFLGSSCIYPKLAPQPISEGALLTGPLEPTNEAYAIAKIAGIIAVRSYRAQYGRRWISAMPTNLYGPGDNFNLESSHVLPAMIRKFYDAATNGGPVTLWGSGSPRREFLHVDDLASAVLQLLRVYDSAGNINIGTGRDVTIRELAQIVASAAGYEGDVTWDTTKPDGTPQKLLDISPLLGLGWRPTIPLQRGVDETMKWLERQSWLDAR